MTRLVYHWFLTLLLCASVFGQAESGGTAAVTGTVLDQSGKALPKAEIVVKNEAGAVVRMVTTGEDGRFSVSGLPSGTYSLETSAAGFAKGTRTGLQLAGGAEQDISISLTVASVNQSVTVEETVTLAAQLAPSGNTLDAMSARTEISKEFIQNFTSPLADFNEVVQLAPGTFSVNSNGVGLGQGKTFFRGFKDGLYSMTYDGIPFQDTNDPTHHSWAFFPGMWIGATDFDRSPGQASTVGPTNFGGSINLLSKETQANPDVRATASYGSFNTRLLDLSLDSGQFFPNQKSSLLLDVHQLLSDGYQTFNYQKRVGGSLKYQYKLNDRTTLSVFGGLLDVWNNTPDTNQPNRAQVAQFGDNFLLNSDPTSPYYYGYSFYHIQTDFEYIDLKSDVGRGWKIDVKPYTYRYWNKQNLEKNLKTLSATSAVDKLNGYRHVGDIMTASQESHFGIFRTGVWYEWAYTDRYQYPSSPFTWADQASPLFHEHFHTQTWQPFAEYEFHVTPRLVVTAGLKDAHYTMNFNQFQDNGKVVGCLGGKLVNGNCVGGAAFISHGVDYKSWLPSAAARYRLRRTWSVYAQFAEGSAIPPTSVFDVANGAVSKPPSPTIAKTYQTGTVWKINRVSLDFDAYYIHFQNPYAAVNDPLNQNEPLYVQTGPSNTKGFEAEGNILLASGLSLYLNGTVGSAKYQNTHLYVANAPKSTGTAGLTWQRKNVDMGFFDKVIGPMYNDNGSVNQAVPIEAFNVANIFFNYTVKNASFLRGSKIGVSVNNLLDNHSVTAIAPAAAATASVPFAPNAGDLLTLLPGRSVMVSLTVGYAPRR